MIIWVLLKWADIKALFVELLGGSSVDVSEKSALLNCGE